MFVVRVVKRSLQENDLTVISIFMNPAQFAPHEDLSTYPRTLPRDLELLNAQSVSIPHPDSHADQTRAPSAIFFPAVSEMYPSGISQDRETQRGTFVEVKGYGDEMEGKSRPGFFRGVATVVTKLFNIIQASSTSYSLNDNLFYIDLDFIKANKYLLWAKGYPTSSAPPTSHPRPPSLVPSALISAHRPHSTQPTFGSSPILKERIFNSG